MVEEGVLEDEPEHLMETPDDPGEGGPAVRLKKSDHRLAGALEKFNRSKAQFDELNDELNAFFNAEPRPHFSHGDFDSDAWEWVERFQIREEPPLLLGVILGDVVHNLRSALDHTICQVSLLDSDGKADCERTQFPIASKSESQFEAMAKDRIPALNAAHRAIVKKVQPYHAGDKANQHPLAVLADLSNADKHRIVNPTFSALETEDLADEAEKVFGPAMDDPESPIRGYYVLKRGQRMEHGTPWFRVVWDRNEEPPKSVKLGYDLTLGIGFGEMGVDAKELPRIAELVKEIIYAFQVDFPETVFED
jgi:hypothetical protein